MIRIIRPTAIGIFMAETTLTDIGGVSRFWRKIMNDHLGTKLLLWNSPGYTGPVLFTLIIGLCCTLWYLLLFCNIIILYFPCVGGAILGIGE